MILARVVAPIWGTRQAPSLAGHKLLLVRPCGQKPSSPGGAPEQSLLEPCLVAIDQLGAGPGQLVLVAHGSRCRDLTVGPTVAAKDVVVALVDATSGVDLDDADLRR